MRPYLALLVFFLAKTSLAQKYVLSNKPQLNQKKSFYHAPIGENQYGIFTLNYANDYLSDGFSIEQYDRELGFVSDRMIDLPRRTYVLRVFLVDSNIYWVTAERKRKENLRLNISSLKANLQGEIQSKFLCSLPLREWAPDDINFALEIEGSHWAVSTLKGMQNGTLHWLKIFDINGRELSSVQDTIKERISDLALTNLTLADSIHCAGILKIQRPKRLFQTRSKDEEVYLFRCLSQNSLNYEIWDSEKTIQTTDLTFDRMRNEWCAVSLVGPTRRETTGYQCVRASLNNEQIENVSMEFTDMQARILDGQMKAKKRRNPRNYVLRRVIPTQGRGMVALLERYVELKQLETFYINGIPQTATKVLYNYNEIGAIFLNKDGLIDTVLRINKEQTAAPGTSYLLGYGSFVCENGIHLVYNNDISKNNEVLDVVIRPDYEIDKHTLVSSDNFYNVVVPFDGLETSYCSFTLPLVRDKQWLWMQVLNGD